MPRVLEEPKDILEDTLCTDRFLECDCSTNNHIVNGSGPCRACKLEGKNPKTGGAPCGGYISGSWSTCSNCGHHWNEHG